MEKRIRIIRTSIMTYSTVILMCISFNTWSQVGVGTSNPDASAALEISSTTKGVLLPRMTKAQMEAITSPAEGLLVYCTDCDPKGMYIFNGISYIASSTGVPSGFNENTDVVSTTGKIWMDRNLGASQVATSLTDHLGYGSLFQWGRAADGHEVINWTSSTTSDGAEQARETAITSATDTPGHDDFITNILNWRSTPNNNLWQGVGGTNNPCPTGYRVPTNQELNAERAAFSTNDAAGAFASPLKFTLSGFRLTSTGALNSVGTAGYYWSSTASGVLLGRSLRMLITSSNVSTGSTSEAGVGASVRCIKE
ncbi:FISUMP domain-containing protein [Flavobacteriaceae bacterium S356]|uniref:FISUMP domain-containing protein n=1 Tax=Asprobacillus argus TaxID=3076534 RepID=A0ABU3LB58_9FLAO|nr:FISUMP domain-containing protein [Flavobacteriaceae bacterium S356]